MRTPHVAIRVLMAALVATLPLVALADDPWETSPSHVVDDTSSTNNQLLHGAIQTHDLEGTSSGATPTDEDWSRVATKNRHSYEVRIFNLEFCVQATPPANCAAMARVNSGGTVLTGGSSPDGGGGGGLSYAQVRWIATADQTDFIKVEGYKNSFNQGVESRYDIQMRETTLNIPRWNQAASQSTVILLRNTTAATITGNLHFYDGAGVFLNAQAVSIPAHGVQGFSTAAIPALSGLSGSASVAHLGNYGAISGKAVALEPATGFTFDTLVEPIPY
jgi:hypothetical protein